MPNGFLKAKSEVIWELIFEDMRMLNKTLLLLFVTAFLSSCSAPDKQVASSEGLPAPPTAKEVILAMGEGFNLGNTFDNGQNSTNFDDIRPIIDLYQEAGMKHIRIPVTWTQGFRGDALSDSLGNVNFEHPRFLELKKVIDYSLEEGLYVVMNVTTKMNSKITMMDRRNIPGCLPTYGLGFPIISRTILLN